MRDRGVGDMPSGDMCSRAALVPRFVRGPVAAQCALSSPLNLNFSLEFLASPEIFSLVVSGTLYSAPL